jgi:hypothetical protein
MEARQSYTELTRLYYLLGSTMHVLLNVLILSSSTGLLNGRILLSLELEVYLPVEKRGETFQQKRSPAPNVSRLLLYGRAKVH